MAILINIKPKTTAVPLCTKAGNFPYNKGGVIADVETARIVKAYNYRGAKLVILRPVIDKLVFEYSFQDFKNVTHTDDLRKAVLKNLKGQQAKGLSCFQPLTIKDVGYKRHKELHRTHKQCLLLKHPETGSKIIIQIDPRNKNGVFIRCDLNPAKLGASGLTYFREKLEGLLAVKPYEITFQKICKIPKLIKRIDIAIDMLGVDASDLEGRYIFKDKTPKNQTFKSTTGRLETQYFVKGTFEENQSYWYNKKKQKIEGKEYDEAPSPYGDALYTRYEYRIQETEKPIHNLHSLLNHLPKVRFRAADYTKIKSKSYTHSLFLRYAMMRTIDKALEVVPSKHHVKYKNSYKSAMLNIWEPEKIWEHWIPELSHLGLIDSAIAKKKSKKNKKKG